MSRPRCGSPEGAQRSSAAPTAAPETTPAMSEPQKIFVNLPVRDLDASRAFFTALGFAFDPRFTDANAACMVVSDAGYVMLLTEDFFRSFTDQPLCDARRATEAIVALSCPSRGEVDALTERALEAGARIAKEPMQCDFMYGRSFHDLDGHHWEVFWMDESAVPAKQAGAAGDR